jgi:butyrate kinase
MRGTHGQFSVNEAFAEDNIIEWFSGTESPDAVIGGAFLGRQLPSGLYFIDEEFKKYMRYDYASWRIINQSATLASGLARAMSSCPLALASVSSREMDAIYKISGIRGMVFSGLQGILRIRAAIHAASEELGISLEKLSVVAAHIGHSFSVCSQSSGRIRDFSDSFERGAFSIRQAGSLPASSVVRMAYSGMWSKVDMLKLVYSFGGLSSYFKEADLGKIASMARNGDAYASMILRAMIYQLAAEMSSHVSALYGYVDAFVLSGECAGDELFLSMLRDKISWICDKILVYKGEDELHILARAALRVLRGEEKPERVPKKPL